MGKKKGVVRLRRIMLMGTALSLIRNEPVLLGPQSKLCWPKLSCQLFTVRPA